MIPSRTTGPLDEPEVALRCAASSPPITLDPLSDFLGRVLADKYRLDAELGRGGMGVVYRGEHTVTGRPIAIKVLRPELAEDRTLGRRFLREVKAAASLTHPNVVGVLDFGIEDDGTAFQVLELLEGESLAERLSRGKLSPARTLALLLPILHALDVAHARGVIHRDLKPDNVFLAENAHGRVVPKLLDFGIAKVREPERPEGARPKETHTTQHGTVIGTPAYMSPEQARGGEVGTASDVWAMAVLLFECLSGRVPFEDENASILMAKIMLERAPSLALVAPEVPRALALAVDAGLQSEPEARPASMAVFRRALREAAATAGIELPAEGVSDCPPETETPRSVPPRSVPAAVETELGSHPAVTKVAARAKKPLEDRPEGPTVESASVEVSSATDERAPSLRSPAATVRTPSIAPAKQGPNHRLMALGAVLALGVAAGVAWRSAHSEAPSLGVDDAVASHAGLPTTGVEHADVEHADVEPADVESPGVGNPGVETMGVANTGPANLGIANTGVPSVAPVPAPAVSEPDRPSTPTPSREGEPNGPPSATRSSETPHPRGHGHARPDSEPGPETTTHEDPADPDRSGLPGLRDWEY